MQLCCSSGILKTRKHVSEIGCFCLWVMEETPTLLGPLESDLSKGPNTVRANPLT
jgi:hypothetical protein